MFYVQNPLWKIRHSRNQPTVALYLLTYGPSLMQLVGQYVNERMGDSCHLLMQMSIVAIHDHCQAGMKTNQEICC